MVCMKSLSSPQFPSNNNGGFLRFLDTPADMRIHHRLHDPRVQVPNVSWQRRFSAWHEMAEDYSRCLLTVCDDKLPAISGLAAALQPLLGSESVAGLWRRILWIDLLWRRADEVDARGDVSVPYRAPS